MKLNKRDSGKIDLSLSEIITIVVSLLILGALNFLRYIFPNNPFVIKYFTGLFAGIVFVLFLIIFVAVNVLITKKRKKNVGSKKGD